MARPVWTGTVVLEKVAVPVTLHVAHDRDEVSFKTLHRDCATPIKQKHVCPHDGAELAAADKAKAFEYSPGLYVYVDAGEIDPPASNELRVAQVVPAAAISALHHDTSYRLEPADDDASSRAYNVLEAALERTALAAVAVLVMYGKERPCAITANGDGLVLTTLYLRRELRTPDTHSGGCDEAAAKLAAKLLNGLAGKFDPDKLVSGQRARVQELVDAKIARGETVAAPGAAAAPADLTAALRASVRPAKPRAKRSRTTSR